MTVVCLVILAGIFWGDFFLKNYIESHVDEREEREICRGEFLIRKHHNKGMMLNAGQKRRRLVAVVSLAFTLILTVVFIVSLGHRGNNLLRLGLSLLLGGAFSNTYDRLRRGYVFRGRSSVCASGHSQWLPPEAPLQFRDAAWMDPPPDK
jgi:signal peptidase II